MANLKKLKDRDRKGRLGTPPAPEEAGNNLDEPEFPLASNEKTAPQKRLSERTKRIGLTVRPEFHKELKTLAVEDGLKIVEVVEKAVELYKARRGD